MTTWSFNSHTFTKCSITEILVIPSIEVHKILVEISSQFSSVFFLDTIGNLTIYNDFYSLNLNIVTVTSIRKFLRVLKGLSNSNTELLIIDSVSFLSDVNVPVYTHFYSLLSSLCTKNNLTIICTNHYRNTTKNCFGPKLGVVWNNLVTHRIFYKYEKNKITYEITTN
ncbi:DNA repair RAD51-like protein 1 [Vairimorpha necatrix]|uniref:DNA repair RAD51-like protein 1 n=1 Tax=Vairimorpha necatrix TaxID=6039 RepID=A0AAX4JE89_9MICR